MAPSARLADSDMEERAEVESESVEVLGLFLIFPRTVPRSVSKD